MFRAYDPRDGRLAGDIDVGGRFHRRWFPFARHVVGVSGVPNSKVETALGQARIRGDRVFAENGARRSWGGGLFWRLACGQRKGLLVEFDQLLEAVGPTLEGFVHADAPPALEGQASS